VETTYEKGNRKMSEKIFKPRVLVINPRSGLATMWSRALFESAPRPSDWIVTYADTPEEVAKLWAFREKTNAVRRGHAWDADA
jgi:hypothetical protein